MIIYVKYLKMLLIILTIAAVACSPVRVRKSTGAKAPAKTEKAAQEKKASGKITTSKESAQVEKLKPRFSDTTVIYLDKPPE